MADLEKIRCELKKQLKKDEAAGISGGFACCQRPKAAKPWPLTSSSNSRSASQASGSSHW